MRRIPIAFHFQNKRYTEARTWGFLLQKHGHGAVNKYVCAAHIARQVAGQKHSHVGHLPGCADATEGHRLQDALDKSWVRFSHPLKATWFPRSVRQDLSGRVDGPRSDTVYADAQGTELARVVFGQRRLRALKCRIWTRDGLLASFESSRRADDDDGARGPFEVRRGGVDEGYQAEHICVEAVLPALWRCFLAKGCRWTALDGPEWGDVAITVCNDNVDAAKLGCRLFYPLLDG